MANQILKLHLSNENSILNQDLHEKLFSTKVSHLNNDMK